MDYQRRIFEHLQIPLSLVFVLLQARIQGQIKVVMNKKDPDNHFS